MIMNKKQALEFVDTYSEFELFDFTKGSIWFRFDEENSYTINHETEGIIRASKMVVVNYIWRNRKIINEWIKNRASRQVKATFKYQQPVSICPEYQKGNNMTIEKAIVELITNAKEIEVLESCAKMLEGFGSLEELATPLRERIELIDEECETLYDIAAGGKFDMDKAF